MDDTPRTDAAEAEANEGADVNDPFYVMCDFARTLERENAQLRKDLQESRDLYEANHG